MKVIFLSIFIYHKPLLLTNGAHLNSAFLLKVPFSSALAVNQMGRIWDQNLCIGISLCEDPLKGVHFYLKSSQHTVIEKLIKPTYLAGASLGGIQ